MATNNVREQKERERRRKKYKFALVLWDEDLAGGLSRYEVTHKEALVSWWQQSYEVICDWEPERVLRGMLKLLEEPK
jgi:hypothetical protein